MNPGRTFMRFSSRSVFPGVVAALMVVCGLLAGCGSSSSTATSVTAPSDVARCAITLNTSQNTVTAAGGTGVVGVTATRDCTWSASAEGGWLSIRNGASGQGEGTVEFAATANPDPQARTGAILVNGSRAQITQSAAECVITLVTSATDFPPAGGSERIEVRASSALCSWTASTDAPWISITPPTTGRGNGSLNITVAATTGPPRTAIVNIGGQQFSVTQSQGCSYATDRTGLSVGANGGAASVLVTAGPGCPWTAVSNVPWVTIASGSSGAGNGEVQITVAPSSGPSRAATLTIAGQPFTISQGESCEARLSSAGVDLGNEGGPRSFEVQVAAGCAWTASSAAPWITITGGSSGSGNGTVAFTVAANPGASRSGTLTAAGQTFTVTQGAGCAFTLSSDRSTQPAGGGSGTVNVTAGSGCGWTAASNAPWLTITSGASGSGNGTVSFTAAANSGPDRTGTLTIGGRTFMVEQAGTCGFTVAPLSPSVPAGGASVRVDVAAQAGCAWTATSNAPWITVSSGAAGTGNGAVQLNVQPNTGAPRTGTVTVAGQTVTITQEGLCSYAVAPEAIPSGAAGGTARVDVTAMAGCAWTATANVPWITVTAGATGTGNGQVTLSIAANPGPPRAGTVTIAGRTVTVSQESGCTFTFSPPSRNIPSSGASSMVSVTTSAGCTWTAVSSVPWIVVTSGTPGTGSGVVEFTVSANTTGTARSGNINIGGVAYSVNQQ
jgi:hypothetical protein